MTKFLGIDWAPLDIPFRRRLETLSIIYFLCDFIVIGPILIFVLFSLLWTPFCWVTILYILWCCYDWNSCNRGGWKWRPGKAWRVWKYCTTYFPVHLVKTSDIDPKRNYIFAAHPHGAILPYGILFNFAADQRKVFPGLRFHFLTVVHNYFFPYHREVSLAVGLSNVSKENIAWLLNEEGLGNALLITPGGAQEALDAAPRTCKLHLKDRKGFVKMALKHGADLVPVMSFGENDVYNQLVLKEGSFGRYLQRLFTKIFKISPPLFYGRGIFQYSFGFLPKRTQITTVVGKPIRVVKCDSEPTSQEVDELHRVYCEDLRTLFNEHKYKYGYADVKFEIK